MEMERLELTVYLPRDKKPINGRVRLELDFATPQAMIEWFESSQELVLPSTAAIFAKDSLDTISDGNTFIVKRYGDRPDDFRLHVERTYTEGV
jgi:hypothetical protein